MDEGLKPCPFCGKNKITIVTTEDLGCTAGDFGYFACCDAQFGGCGASSGWQPSEEDATDAWNRRQNDR